jgi:hypothetical protein
MFCTKCGTSRPDGMTVCPNCGTAALTFAEPPKIQNYLVPSILVTLCCCVPAGIVAIVYAAQVNSKLAAGDVAGAQESARLAKIWSWVAFGCGALVGIIYAIIGAMGALGNMH